ncbi:MAG: formylglycine-generating enzyme family protein [Anaerolineae bacterium]|nr:formylglycine-generating enzyme family protein [Anaerolineae bacterium]
MAKLNKFLTLVAAIVLLLLMVGCGGGVDEFASPQASGADTSVSESTNTPTPAGTPTATPYTLATPTPLPPPPTPTPLPPTPTPEPKEEQAETTEETEPEAPPIPEVMIEIPAGPFTMGSDDGDPEDAPAHEVDLPAYEIDKFEITNINFSAFADATDYVTYAEQQGFDSWRDEWGIGEDSHPVVRVSWDDANAYCEWLGKRLPTEAEWEKAARGDDGRRFAWGNDWDPNKANVKERGLRGTAVVGSFGEGASPYGVEDMIGNVWEWTADWYQPYPGNTTDDLYYGEQFKVTRGGGWFDEEPQATTFNRNAGDPTKTASDELGFRCVR